MGSPRGVQLRQEIIYHVRGMKNPRGFIPESSRLTVIDREEVSSILFEQKSPIVFVGIKNSISVTQFTDCRIHQRTCTVDKDPKRDIGIRKIA